MEGVLVLSSGEWWMLLFTMCVLVAVLKRRPGSTGAGSENAGKGPYRRAGALFTPAERSFLAVLDQAVGPGYRVFGKVRMADVAEVERGLAGSVRRAALDRLGAECFDFVVCRADDLAPVCAIGLEGRPHADGKAHDSDGFKANVCVAIGLPLLVLPARHASPVHEVRQRFRAALSPAVRREKPLPAEDLAGSAKVLRFAPRVSGYPAP